MAEEKRKRGVQETESGYREIERTGREIAKENK